jgi:hypothetical protein
VGWAMSSSPSFLASLSGAMASLSGARENL